LAQAFPAASVLIPKLLNGRSRPITSSRTSAVAPMLARYKEAYSRPLVFEQNFSTEFIFIVVDHWLTGFWMLLFPP
jgi:hypothetical protein